MKGTILITGATGFIGSMVVKTLIQEPCCREIDKLILCVRNQEKLKRQQIFWDYSSKTEIEKIETRLEMINCERFSGSIDYIIHCACPTSSSYMISNPVETADAIVLGTRNVLELARQHKVKGMVYLSSMEVYGSVPDIGRPRREDELGTISIDSARSCYPLGKRMAEHYCYTYAKEYGVPVKVARLAQTFGTGVRSDDNRVYMQFARAVKEEKDIVLKTQGLSMGNYCATEDVVDAIFTILHKGKAGEVYNVVNEENTMCIRDMAQLVAQEVAGGRIDVRIEPEDSEKTGYAPDTQLRLSGEKLRELGWKPTKNLKQMYEDVLKEI